MNDTALTIDAHRPGARAWVALTIAEMKMVVRDTSGLLIPIVLPLLILVMYGLGYRDAEALPGHQGRAEFDLFVIPVVMTMVLAVIGVVNMPSFLAYYRRTGVLRRLAVTPAHPSMVLIAQVLTSVAQTLVGVGLALVVAFAAFDASLPVSPLMTLAVFALAAAAMYAVGILIASVAPSGNASVALGMVAFFAMGATGGMFGSTEILPGPMARIGEVLPFGAAASALGDAWAGQSPELLHLASLAGAIAFSSLVAARFFRWD